MDCALISAQVVPRDFFCAPPPPPLLFLPSGGAESCPLLLLTSIPLIPSRSADQRWSISLLSCPPLHLCLSVPSRAPPARLPLSAAAASAPSVEQEHRTESHLSAHTLSTRARTVTHSDAASCSIPHGAAAFPAAYQVRPRREMGGAAPGCQSTQSGWTVSLVGGCSWKSAATHDYSPPSCAGIGI